MTIDRAVGYTAAGLAGLALLGATLLAVSPDSTSATAPPPADTAVLDTGTAAWTGGSDADLGDALSGSWLLGDPISPAITLPAPPGVPDQAPVTVLDAGTGVSTPASSANSALSSLITSMARLPMMAFRLLGSPAKELAGLPSVLEHDPADSTGADAASAATQPTPDQLFTADPTLGGVLGGDGSATIGPDLDLGAAGDLPGDLAPVDGLPVDLIPLP